jgi:hypothetical protein
MDPHQHRATTKEHRRRMLTVGAQQYLWKNYHQHVDGCEESYGCDHSGQWQT